MVAGLTAEHRAGPGALPAAQSHLCCRPSSDTSAGACPLGIHTHFFSPFILIEVPTPPSMLTRTSTASPTSGVRFSLGFSFKVCSSRCTPAWGPQASLCLEPVPCLGSRERPSAPAAPPGIRFLTHRSPSGARLSQPSSLGTRRGLFRHSPGCAGPTLGVSDAAGPRWGRRICISDAFRGNADAPAWGAHSGTCCSGPRAVPSK